MPAEITRELNRALRADDADGLRAALNSVPRDQAHEKRAVKLLILAIEKRRAEMPQALLDWGADPNGEQGSNKTTPLVAAARVRNADAIRALLLAGADVEKRDGFGWTPLQAASCGSLKASQVLVEAGADVNAGKTTPLSWAANSEQEELVEYLLGRGAHIDAEGNSALWWAIWHGRARVVQVLVESGAPLR
jgi:ankyrin repeat protein